tara:strand:- start:2865 stop:3572 length:708 start_codon:yes stop_codon:yes gene_type:complete
VSFENIIVIIPTYNESENIEKLIRELKSSDFHIMIIDDNSPDGTSKVVENLIKEFNNLLLFKRESKLGLGSAYRDGFKEALKLGYKQLVEMDADFSHQIADLKRMIENSKNADVVIGSRYVEGGKIVGWNTKRKLLSKSANLFTKFLFKYNINDSTSGFRIYTAESLKKINYANTKSDGYSFQVEMTYRSHLNKLKIIEVPITFFERREGQSKMTGNIINEAIISLFKLKFGKIE